ncbi:hypothetical protein [Mesorhizobium sp.]|uniref:hypothetical protein n=1 Tax=Mesorhizobium sp. TaxID=1871066 RepID=UPI00344C48C0
MSGLGSRSLFCRGSLDLLVLSLLLLAWIDVRLVVVCGRCLFGWLFRWGRFDLLLLVAPLLAGLFGLGRRDLLGRNGFGLLLQVAPLLAGLLFGLGRRDLLGRGRFGLLLQVAPLLAGLLFGLGRRDLLGRGRFGLLLQVAPLLSGLFGLGRRDLLRRSGFLLPLLVAPLLSGLLRLCLLVLRAGLGRLALGAIRLHWHELRCSVLQGAKCGTALQREST